MAINRYDVPAQDNYKNTYVPLPYEQIMGTVAARQAQLQREQDMLNKTYEDTQNLKYIPDTKDEAYVRNYLSKTGDIVNKYYGQDMSNPIVKAQMRREFSNITDKQTIQNIQSSQAAWMTNQKYKGQLKAEGLYDPAIDEDPANGTWDTTTNGVYQYIAPSYKNPRPAAETYFNNIKASDLGVSGDYNYSGVNRTKIDEVANAKWGEFTNTSEGNLYVKKIAKERGLDYTDTKVRQQIGIEYLKGVGEEFIYRDQGTATLDAQVRATKGKKDTTNPEYNNSSVSQTIRTKADFDPMGLGNMQFKDDGKVWVPEAKGSINVQFGYGAMSNNVMADNNYKKEASAAEIAQTAKLESLRSQIPQLKGLNDKDTYTAYKELTQDGKALADLPTREIPGIPREKWAETLATSMLNRQLMVMDDFGSTDLRSAIDTEQGSPLKDLGYTTQTLKQELMLAAKKSDKATVSVGGIAQNGPMAGMLQLEVLDRSGKGGNKGKVRKLYISTNDQMQAIMSPTNDVYNNIRNFKHGITPLGKDASGNTIAIEVIPAAQQDPNTKKWVYDYQLNEGYLTPDGKIISPDPLHPNGIPTTMQRIGDMQLNRLRNSGYTNSEVNFTNDNTSPSF